VVSLYIFLVVLTVDIDVVIITVPTLSVLASGTEDHLHYQCSMNFWLMIPPLLSMVRARNQLGKPDWPTQMSQKHLYIWHITL